jgi:hypothetical protein
VVTGEVAPWGFIFRKVTIVSEYDFVYQYYRYTKTKIPIFILACTYYLSKWMSSFMIPRPQSFFGAQELKSMEIRKMHEFDRYAFVKQTVKHGDVF